MLVVDLTGDADPGRAVLPADPQQRVLVVDLRGDRLGVRVGGERQGDRVEAVPGVLADQPQPTIGEQLRHVRLERGQLLRLGLT